MPLYSKSFYTKHLDRSRLSATEIVPFIVELIQPQSVIDVGCGLGTWLAVFKECGVEDILGVDGNWVNKEWLQIPADYFLPFDLNRPLSLERQFDLVVSLEVAEHLPKDCAATFVDSLVRLGPVILFFAAIPFQGGVNHINEQWPEYWVKLFQAKGYLVIDCIRKKIWKNDKVKYEHAQNMLLFARHDYLADNLLLQQEHNKTAMEQLSVVHPSKYLSVVDPRHMPPEQVFKVLAALPSLILNFVKRYLDNLTNITGRRKVA